MCTQAKAEKLMRAIGDSLFDIHEKFGTEKGLSVSYIRNEKTGDIIALNLKIPAGPTISSSLSMDLKRWHPKRVERELLPILQAVATA